MGQETGAVGSQTGQFLTFARWLNSALQDPTARAALHRALRESTMPEYKLVLENFADWPEGQAVLEAMRKATGERAEDVRGAIRALPRVEVYMPLAAHRKTWRSDEEVSVVVRTPGSTDLFGISRSGAAVILDKSVAPVVPTLLIAPAESKWRPGRKQRTGGDTLTVVPMTSEFCDPTVLLECNIDGGGGGTPEQRLVTLQTNGICDNGNCSEGNEFEFPSTDSNGLFQSRLRCEGIGNSEVVGEGDPRCTGGMVVHGSTVFEVAFLDVIVKETDGFLNVNGDDIFSDFIAPPPGFFFHAPRVTQIRNGFAPLWQSNTGYGATCASTGGMGCNQWVAVQFAP